MARTMQTANPRKRKCTQNKRARAESPGAPGSESGGEDSGEDNGEDRGEKEGEEAGEAGEAGKAGEAGEAGEAKEDDLEAFANGIDENADLDPESSDAEDDAPTLRAKIKALKAQLVAKDTEIEALGGGQASGSEGPSNEGTQKTAVRKTTAKGLYKDNFALSMTLPKNHRSATPPYNFKADGYSFPHFLQTDRHNGRLFVVETRNYITISCQLYYLEQNETRVAHEGELVRDGQLYFRLNLCYANSGRQVLPRDINRQALFDPSDNGISAFGKMNAGVVSWRLKLNALSRSTSPINQKFFFCVKCCNEGLEGLDLTVESPVFLSVSRDLTARKDKKAQMEEA